MLVWGDTDGESGVLGREAAGELKGGGCSRGMSLSRRGDD